MTDIDRHQGQLVTADNELEPAALPPVAHVSDLSHAEQADLWLNDHPEILGDLITLIGVYADHPSVSKVSMKWAWEQVRLDRQTVGRPLHMPNSFTPRMTERVLQVKPKWAGLFRKGRKRVENIA